MCLSVIPQVSEPALSAQWLAPPQPMEMLHSHTEIELNAVFEGKVRYFSTGRFWELGAGDLAVFWGSPPHALVHTRPQSCMAWVTVPLPWVLGWGLKPGLLRGLLTGRCYMSKGGVGRYAVRDWVHEIAQGEGKAVLLEIQACLLRLGPGPCHSVLDASSSPGWRHVRRMSEFLASNYHQPVGVSEVADSAGLHPKYALTLFHKSLGLTIREYLERLRLAHAQRLLLQTDDKIASVAEASGFCSLSAFYARFARATGRAPADFRRMARSAARVSRRHRG